MDYKNIVELALQQSRNKIRLSEGVRYPEGISERMHPELERDLKTQNHSLGKHPAFPEGDECSFEEKILGERFADVVRRYKRAHDITDINEVDLKKGMMSMVYQTMEIEADHEKELEDLAVKMIREEYDMDEDAVEIQVKLTPKIDISGTQKNASPVQIDEMEFDSHEQIVEANEEVYKRRFLNAMIQGAAKKCNQMFHLADDELLKIDPRLTNMYSKMMASADYMYYTVPKLEGEVNGGVVRVEFPSKKNPKAIIIAEAMTFPVLIHELVKGVMELLSAHGLPKNKKVAKYVLGKADFLAAEMWDMRLGPALWEQFTKLIEADDFKLKHHIYADLVALPVKEFNRQMKEILAGTKAGKKIIQELTDSVKNEFLAEELEESLGPVDEENEGDEEGFNWDEINPYL